jgi:hypothetical protein
MLRLTGLFILLVSSVYGAGVCQCPPSIIALINGTNYSNNFVVTTLSNNQGYNINASISTNLFQFAMNVNTQPDPEIDFGMSISGDPDVSIIITQTFLGGPFPNFFSTSSGTITDANNDGHASMLGSPYIQTTFVNGVLVGQQNTGCDLTGSAGFTAPCPSASLAASALGGQFNASALPPHGILELDIAFSLSEGDAATLTGSSVISAAAVPEPAAGFLFATGLLAVAGLGFRRLRRKVH